MAPRITRFNMRIKLQGLSRHSHGFIAVHPEPHRVLTVADSAWEMCASTGIGRLISTDAPSTSKADGTSRKIEESFRRASDISARPRLTPKNLDDSMGLLGNFLESF